MDVRLDHSAAQVVVAAPGECNLFKDPSCELPIRPEVWTDDVTTERRRGINAVSEDVKKQARPATPLTVLLLMVPANFS